MKPKEFLNALDDNAIAQAIEKAERHTSGEIRVYVTEHPVTDPVKQGQKKFVELGMTATELRNGVLLFFAPKSQVFAVIGDEGIHQRCGQPLWDQVTASMTPLLKAGHYTQAILSGVHQIGEVLAKEFPWKRCDRNELPNTVARDEPEP